MERRGISIDRQVLSQLSADFAQTAARIEAEIQRDRRRTGQYRQPPSSSATSCSARWACRAAARPRPAHGRPRRRCSTTSPNKATNSRARSRLATGVETDVDLYRRAAELRPSADPSRPHDLRAGGDHQRDACRPTNRTCRTFRCVPRTAARSAAPSSPRPATSWCRPTIRRSNCDCWPRSPISRAEAGLPGRARHSRHDGVGNVRRAGQGHAGGNPPPRQGDQFRHHLRHLGVRPRQPAQHPREEAGAYIKKYFERFPGIRAYMDQTRDFCREHGYVQTLFGRKCHYPDIKASNASIRAFNERAVDQCAACRAPPPISSAAP